MNVLLVEDDMTLRNTLSLVLQTLQYKVISVSNAEDALVVMKSVKPDILLTDVNLGVGMNGEDLLVEAKKIYPNLFVIVMSAYSNVNRAVKCMKNGAFYYMAKPMELSELESVLHDIELAAKNIVQAPKVQVSESSPIGSSLDDLERKHIATVLDNSGSLQEAATTLGVDLSTLWRKRKQYDLLNRKPGKKGMKNLGSVLIAA